MDLQAFRGVDVADRDEIQVHLTSDYFPQVTLLVAECGGKPAGFAGVAGNSLEMLFVHADFRGRGIGKTLLTHVIEEHGVRAVDVNEDNAQAVRFYEIFGFEPVLRRRASPIRLCTLRSETLRRKVLQNSLDPAIFF